MVACHHLMLLLGSNSRRELNMYTIKQTKRVFEIIFKNEQIALVIFFSSLSQAEPFLSSRKKKPYSLFFDISNCGLLKAWVLSSSQITLEGKDNTQGLFFCISQIFIVVESLCLLNKSVLLMKSCKFGSLALLVMSKTPRCPGNGVILWSKAEGVSGKVLNWSGYWRFWEGWRENLQENQG